MKWYVVHTYSGQEGKVKQHLDAFVERIAIGPPDGMRIAVKDCIDVAGFSTRLGSRALSGSSVSASRIRPSR